MKVRCSGLKEYYSYKKQKDDFKAINRLVDNFTEPLKADNAQVEEIQAALLDYALALALGNFFMHPLPLNVLMF